jgi:hypothetical protein
LLLSKGLNSYRYVQAKVGVAAAEKQLLVGAVQVARIKLPHKLKPPCDPTLEPETWFPGFKICFLVSILEPEM